MDTQKPRNLEEDTELPLVEIIRDPNTAAVLLKPPRPAVLAALRTPDSASGLARRLQQPRQRLGHHLRNLEKVGLVRLVAERRHVALTERGFQATARSYVLSPTLLGDLGALSPEDVLRVAGSGWPPLAAVAGRMLQDVAVLTEQRGDDVAGLAGPTQVRFASPAAFQSFVEDLAREVERLLSRYHDESTPTIVHWFVLAAYPPPPPAAGSARS